MITPAALLAAAFAAAAVAAPGPNGTLWGAIRWDAWYNSSSDPGDPGQVTARVLAPLQWHDRLPWFSYILPDGNVTFDNNAATTMDAEIEYAVNAGIDHWVRTAVAQQPGGATRAGGGGLLEACVLALVCV